MSILDETSIKHLIETAILLAGFVGALKVFCNPLKRLKMCEDRIGAVERKIGNIDDKMDSAKITYDEWIRIQKLQCKAMANILNHMIDGNGVETMKETRSEIMELLTDIK